MFFRESLIFSSIQILSIGLTSFLYSTVDGLFYRYNISFNVLDLGLGLGLVLCFNFIYFFNSIPFCYGTSF